MKSQFGQFIESSPDAIIVLDRDGRIRQANAPAASLFGFDPAGLRNLPIRRLLPDQPVPLVPDDRAGPAMPASRVELVGRRSDTSQFRAELQVVPIRAGGGPAAVVTVRDLTEQQREQMVLQRTLDVLHASDRDRQLLLGQLVRAQEEERKRIAAGIHDDTIQVITSIHLQLQRLRLRLRDPSEGQALGKLEDALQSSLSRLRKLIFELRPARLEENDLPAALRSYLEEMHSSAGIVYQLDDQLSIAVPPSTSVLLYRTAQEALMNIRKHARATRVLVTLTDLADGCLVRISDNGVGYNPADVENSPGHLGLALMRERPQMAGGWCGIESAPGAGTTVEFWVPAGPPPSSAESAA
jgi:PAS domain S-box-containing protein